MPLLLLLEVCFIFCFCFINSNLQFFLPKEPIQELGKQIKADGISKGYNSVLLFGYSNNHIGYVTTAREYLIGGYESQLTFWGINTANYIRGNISLALDKVSKK